MKAKDVQIGQIYQAKVSGNLTSIRICHPSVHGGWEAINLLTGRTIRIRTAGRLRPALLPTAGFGVGV